MNGRWMVEFSLVRFFFCALLRQSCGSVPSTASPPETSFTVLLATQSYAPHDSIARALREWLLNQITERSLGTSTAPWISGNHEIDLRGIVLSHEVESWLPGSWTFLPLIRKYGILADWVFLGTERTRLDLDQLWKWIADSGVRSKSSIFVGRKLVDQESTIIHHYAQPNHMQFPDLNAGVLLSRTLVEQIIKVTDVVSPMDFTIDVAYELALLISSVGGDAGAMMDGGPSWSCEDRKRCVTNSLDATALLELERTVLRKVDRVPIVESGSVTPIDENSIFFAVKTCASLAPKRLPSIEATWIPDAKHFAYFSDEADIPYSPVVVLPPETNVPRGFCAKTWSVFVWFLKNETSQEMDWLFLSDDDTLVSVLRLRRLLGAYNARSPVVVGQRYGFALNKPTGYSYPTGGAGIALSRPALEQIILGCPCPRPDTPDDMYLGMCLNSLNIPLLHIDEMHQARPQDYPPSILASQRAISFHKLWGQEALDAYRLYLLDETNNVVQNSSHIIHSSRMGKKIQLSKKEQGKKIEL